FGKVFVINLPSRTDHHDAMLLTAALSDIQLDWIDGVRGEAVSDKVLFAGVNRTKLGNGNIGSWRWMFVENLTRFFFLSRVVQQNLSSALIFEDDIDWDVRIKSQMRNVAMSTRALIQPLSSNPSRYADRTYPNAIGDRTVPPDMYIDKLPSTIPPNTSPYGDGWDILWLGHRGAHFPNMGHQQERAEASRIPKGRVVHLNDPTVPEDQYHDFWKDEGVPSKYPQHTRTVHHIMGGICSFAYAVSQAGARSLLHDASTTFKDPFDAILMKACSGLKPYKYLNCLTVRPPLFSHHRPAGRRDADSEITMSENRPGTRKKGMTHWVRWSVRLNIEKLLRGRTDFDDQYPDVSTESATYS
ncbi:hypothetical protein GP486_004096, partial [Trichoglossum hirsutum]